MERMKVTQKQRHEISLILNQHCKSVDGHAVYDAGWDDAAVAMAAGVAHPNAHRSVSYMRDRIYGPIRRSAAPEDKLSDRLAVLESDIRRVFDRLKAVEESIQNMEQKRKTQGSRISRLMTAHNGLCSALTNLDNSMAQYEVQSLIFEKANGQS